MGVRADIVATARATVGHIIRFFSSSGVDVMPNRQYLDFAGNCTVNDDGTGIKVTIPEVPAGSVTVGNVITLPPGTMAYVTNSGTPIHAILNFGIPRGDAGPEVQELWQRVQALESSLAETQDALAALTQTVADNDAAAVHKAGEETVTGVKTFEGGANVPTVDIDDSSEAAASTAWVNAKLLDIYYYARDGQGGTDTDTSTDTSTDTDTTTDTDTDTASDTDTTTDTDTTSEG